MKKTPEQRIRELRKLYLAVVRTNEENVVVIQNLKADKATLVSAQTSAKASAQKLQGELTTLRSDRTKLVGDKTSLVNLVAILRRELEQKTFDLFCIQAAVNPALRPAIEEAGCEPYDEDDTEVGDEDEDEDDGDENWDDSE